MSRLFEPSSKPAGSSPGTVIYVGEKRTAPISISRISYSSTVFEEEVFEQNTLTDLHNFAPAAEQAPSDKTPSCIWYNIDGIHDAALLEKLGDAFGLHPLVVEDIVNTNQRPKIEDFGNYLFLALKMIVYDREQREIKSEHVSIILGKGFVLSFLEDSGDVFDPVRQRLKTAKGRLRREGADYLAYALLDSIVDGYFEVLEALGEDLEGVEFDVLDNPSNTTLRSIHTLKRELIYLRRAVWPLRETINVMLRDESDLITSQTRIFLRDLYDHSVNVIDSVETLRDIVAGMLDVYLSSASNKMNQVMKVLTVMSSIFIPLTFVAGVYGMNFKYMPELESSFGYPSVLAFMATIAVSLLIMFRKKGWI